TASSHTLSSASARSRILLTAIGDLLHVVGGAGQSTFCGLGDDPGGDLPHLAPPVSRGGRVGAAALPGGPRPGADDEAARGVIDGRQFEAGSLNEGDGLLVG